MTYCARPVPNPVAGFFFARVFRIVAPSRPRYTLAAFSGTAHPGGAIIRGAPRQFPLVTLSAADL